MDPNTKRNIQIVMAVAILAATARTAWIFYQRHESEKATNTATAPVRKLHNDDYVFLRPSHVYDLASAKKFLVGKTVWVKAGNAVAYYPSNAIGKKESGVLAPLADINVTDVETHGSQIMARFVFGNHPQPGQPAVKPPPPYAVPIGSVRNDDYNFIMDDIFYYEDPHKLYDWSKDQWDAIARHEITKGMSEAMAQAAMGVGHAPEGASSNGEYGNRTLVYSDPAHPDKQVTVTFADNAAVAVH